MTCWAMLQDGVEEAEVIEYLADCGYEPLGDVLREARDPADLGTIATSGLKRFEHSVSREAPHTEDHLLSGIQPTSFVGSCAPCVNVWVNICGCVVVSLCGATICGSEVRSCARRSHFHSR